MDNFIIDDIIWNHNKIFKKSKYIEVWKRTELSIARCLFGKNKN